MTLYRCAACDTPGELGHTEPCPMKDYMEEEQVGHEEDERINVASGEDVVCG